MDLKRGRMGGCRLDSTHLQQEPCFGWCDCGSIHLGYIKCGECLA